MRQPAHLIFRLVPLAILAIGVAVACVSRDAADPLLQARVLSVDGEALDRLLTRSAALAGTPIARTSARLKRQVESCDQVWANLVPPAEGKAPDLAGAIGCADQFSAADAPLEVQAARGGEAVLFETALHLRGNHDGLLLWPIGDDGRLEIRFDVAEDGSLQIDGIANPPSEANALRLLVPGDEPPAAPILARSDALLYARARPAGGLALSKLIPAGSQGDRLFAMKGRLLEGALLDGTWEFAFMPPADGTDLPLATLALHHRLAGPVKEALNEALNQLERTWPIQRTPRTFINASGMPLEGGCYFDLPLLPGLAPCWVVTPEALLIGYRDLALEAALRTTNTEIGGRGQSAPGPETRFGELAIRLSELASSESGPPAGSSIEDVEPAALQTPPGINLGDVYSDLAFGFQPQPSGQIALRGELKANR